MKAFLFFFFISYLYSVKAEKNFTAFVSMDDGVKLSTDIYLPDVASQYSCILIRTPYKKEGAAIFANFFQSCGFAVAVQDVRGKYASEGTFEPFLNEYKDGLSTLNWIEKQKWCNGSIGMWGSSYLGYSSLILAQSKHPALKSIFTISAWIDGDLINQPGGAFHQMLIIPWLLSEGHQSQKSIKGMDLDQIFNHLPLKEVVPTLSTQNDTNALEKRDFSNQDYNYDQVQIPICQMGGWYDFATPASLKSYKNLSNANNHLILGPWYHNQIYDDNEKVGEYQLPSNGKMSLTDMLNKACEWFDQTLNDQLIPKGKVNYYVLFEDKWKVSKYWPPENSHRKEFYLNKSLLNEESDSNKSYSQFIYNPKQPNPTIGGANFHFFPSNMGIKNQIKSLNRKDVISFETTTFQEMATYAGEVVLELHISSEGIGTDFTAKLCKVDTINQVWNLVDGIYRIESKVELSKVHKISLSLGHTAFKIKKGEKLLLQISSSNFPKYNRNPNTGIHPMDATELKAVLQSIYHYKKFPSKLILNQLNNEKH